MSKVKQNKMDAILDKFGLNSTKHQLFTPVGKKHQYSKQKSTSCIACSKTDHKTSLGNLSPPIQPIIKNSNLSPEFTSSKRRSYFQDNYPIDVAIKYLKEKINHECKCPQHDKCGIKFICLQQYCKNKLGCAHCFLFCHRSHHKAQLSTVINQLKEFKQSYLSKQKQIKLKLTTIKSQVLCQLDKQLNNIREQFENSLVFLKRKAYSQIDSYFKEKYEFFDKDTPFNVQRQFENQKQLLRELTRWKVSQFQNNQTDKLQGVLFQKHRLDCFREYFQQMNSSISQMFSAFKRSMPRIFQNPPNHNSEMQLIHNTFHNSLANKQRQFIASNMVRSHPNI